MEHQPSAATEISPFGLACWQDSPEVMPGFHRHNDVEVNFIEEGSITYQFGAAQLTVGAGQLALFWAAMPHQLVQIEAPASMYWLTIPLATFLRWQLHSTISTPVLNGKLVGAADETLTYFDQVLFRQWRADLSANSEERRAIVLMELEARLRRMALVSTAVHGPTAALDGTRVFNGGRRRAEQMVQFIAEHYAEAIRVEDIARAAGLHPNYAMHLFRRTFGLRLTDYLLEHRVAHAQRLLVTTDLGVLEVALEVGFGSASRFYAAFKQICGQAPGAYRTSVRTPRANAVQISGRLNHRGAENAERLRGAERGS